MTEDEILAMEAAAMDAERAWLLRNHVPKVLRELTNLMQESLQGCDLEDAKPGLTLPVSSGASDLLKGFVTVNGSNVVKLDLTVKFPHFNRGTPYRVGLSPKANLLLQQVQNARNYSVHALDVLESRPYSSLRDKWVLLEVMTRVSEFVHQARFSLTNVDETLLFPNKECESKLFSPELPEDIVVELYVNGASLVVSVMALEFQNFLQVQLGKNKLLTRLKGMPVSAKYHDRTISVADQMSIETPSPKLLTLINNLSKAEDMCIAMCDKIRSL